MSILDKEIADVLNGKHTKSSSQVTQLIERVLHEIPNIEAEQATFEASASNPAILGDDVEAARQKAVSAEFQLKRLARAKEALVEYRDRLVVAERDERQKAEHATWIKDRKRCEREIAEFLNRLPHFARVLHRAVELDQVGQRFFARPIAGTPMNPKDVMVSDYERLPPVISDKMRKGIRLVSADGTVLFAHTETNLRHPANARMVPAKSENFRIEKESLRQAREHQIFARTLIREIEQAAEANSTSVEQAAVVKGYDAKGLSVLRNQADGKFVNEAMDVLKKAHASALNSTP